MRVKPPRRCRPAQHKWVFTEALITGLFLDGAVHQLAWTTCTRCGCALELGGTVDRQRARLRDETAGLWGRDHGYQRIPLN